MSRVNIFLALSTVALLISMFNLITCLHLNAAKTQQDQMEKFITILYSKNGVPEGKLVAVTDLVETKVRRKRLPLDVRSTQSYPFYPMTKLNAVGKKSFGIQSMQFIKYKGSGLESELLTP